MDPAINDLFALLGWSHYVELAGVLVALCSAIDAALPQPAPGSHWLPVRKAISYLALNIAHAGNDAQPSLATWILRIVRALVAADQTDKVKAAKRAEKAPSA